VQTVYPEAHALYLDLHQNPELSSHETQTADKLAGRLRDLGYTVTEHVGGTGVVAILKNGAGPTVMLRTELDALPVEEKTGLPYASKIHTKDDSGREVGVMHACGHDVHMASLFGTAAIMTHSKNTWHGTLILIGQPAEETISGVKRMIEDGLMTRFPKPDIAVALHVGNNLPAGQVGVGPGHRFSTQIPCASRSTVRADMVPCPIARSTRIAARLVVIPDHRRAGSKPEKWSSPWDTFRPAPSNIIPNHASSG
jgi:hippurate hydrolase